MTWTPDPSQGSASVGSVAQADTDAMPAWATLVPPSVPTAFGEPRKFDAASQNPQSD